jgi:hypothetical protein
VITHQLADGLSPILRAERKKMPLPGKGEAAIFLGEQRSRVAGFLGVRL